MKQYLTREGDGSLEAIFATSLQEAKGIASGNQKLYYTDLFVFRRTPEGKDILLAQRIHSDPSVKSFPAVWEDVTPDWL